MHHKLYIPKHSTVAAYLALFASLTTGGALAATQLAPNSVGSRQIRTHAIQLSDLSPTAIAALRGKLGPTGATGPQGPTGDTGATGHISPANIIQREATGPIVTTPGEGRFVGIGCALDERVLGGGGHFLSTTTSDTPTLMYSAPSPNEHQWDVGFTPDTTIGGRAHVYAICLKP